MKKLIFVLLFLALIAPVFAQNDQRTTVNSDTNMYVINVPVEKIYPTGMGYIIFYRKLSSTQLGTVTIPNAWVYDAAGRAEFIRLPRGVNWPSMSVFYRGGEFNHVRVYVHASKAHITWGAVDQTFNPAPYFQDPDNFNITY
jgi:hypothetical protein